MWWLILCVNLTGLKGAQKAGKTLFLGLSLKVFWEEISRLIQLADEQRSFLTNVNKHQPISGENECNRKVQFSSVQLLSRVQLFATPWTAARQASLSITNSQSLLKLMPMESVMSSSHLILCHPLLLLPPIPPSIRVFSNESTLLMRWPRYWSFSFSISPSNEYPGLISFRMDWLDLLAVQGTLKSLLQHHSSKASIFWCSAFFTVQLSHPYMTTRKTIAKGRSRQIPPLSSWPWDAHFLGSGTTKLMIFSP